MDSQTDTSYQDDILKVKQIWDDLKEVENSSKKVSYNKKNKNQPENNKKSNLGQKKPKRKQQSHQAKSHLNINPQKVQSNGEIISFSTVIQSQHETYKNYNPTQQSNPNLNSKYIESLNFRTTIQQKDKELSILRVQNQWFKDRLAKLQKQIEEKNSLISKLKSRQHQLLGVTAKFSSEKVEALSQSVEYMNCKNDSMRLLKMLQSTQEYHQFAKLGLQDDGVKFLSLVKKKSSIDALSSSKNEKPIHFCSCNSQFIPEENFWVPSKVFQFSNLYVKEHKGEALNEAQIELLLYELNKIWRERQKKIINSMNSSKSLEMSKYKRKIQEMSKL